MPNEERMELEIKGMRFRGTAGQFERAMGQVIQMVGGQQGYPPQLQQAPETVTAPSLPSAPAPITPPPLLPMAVTAEGYDPQRFRAFQAVYNEFKPSTWIEIGYVTDSQKRIFEELLAVFGREDAALTCLRNALKAVSVDPHWQCRTSLEEFAVDNRIFHYHQRWLARLIEQQHQLQPFAEPPTQLCLAEPPQQHTTDDLARQLFELVKQHSQAAQSPRDNRMLNDTPLTGQPAIDVDSLMRKPATTDQAATVIQTETTAAIDVDSLIRNPTTTTPKAVDRAAKLRQRQRLRRKGLLWLLETISFLSLAVSVWLVFQHLSRQPTPVASPTPSPSATKKPAKTSRPNPVRPPSEPPPLSSI